jgi:hypothetical protein
VGCAVGASYAVLVAEQMFAAGCGLLLSVTSSGQITPRGSPPYFILIDRALRDDLYQAMIARSQCASSKESIEPKGVYCRLYGKANKPFNAMIPQRPLRPYSDFQNLT